MSIVNAYSENISDEKSSHTLMPYSNGTITFPYSEKKEILLYVWVSIRFLHMILRHI
jgi:hypothetical protein